MDKYGSIAARLHNIVTCAVVDRRDLIAGFMQGCGRHVVFVSTKIERDVAPSVFPCLGCVLGGGGSGRRFVRIESQNSIGSSRSFFVHDGSGELVEIVAAKVQRVVFATSTSGSQEGVEELQALAIKRLDESIAAVEKRFTDQEQRLEEAKAAAVEEQEGAERRLTYEQGVLESAEGEGDRALAEKDVKSAREELVRKNQVLGRCSAQITFLKERRDAALTELEAERARVMKEMQALIAQYGAAPAEDSTSGGGGGGVAAAPRQAAAAPAEDGTSGGGGGGVAVAPRQAAAAASEEVVAEDEMSTRPYDPEQDKYVPRLVRYKDKDGVNVYGEASYLNPNMVTLMTNKPVNGTKIIVYSFVDSSKVRVIEE
ncbi:hypothetical protein K0U07_05290 [bacterium]|nr:hypothetical protein [bacterium]